MRGKTNTRPRDYVRPVGAGSACQYVPDGPSGTDIGSLRSKNAGVLCVNSLVPVALPPARTAQWDTGWGVIKSSFPVLSSCISRPHGIGQKHQPAHSWRLLKSTSTGEGWGLRFFVKGERRQTRVSSVKKRL